jgi:hypothetical protein
MKSARVLEDEASISIEELLIIGPVEAILVDADCRAFDFQSVTVPLRVCFKPRPEITGIMLKP